MGEKIRDIGKFELGEKTVVVELNEGYNKEYSKYDIHIQSDYMQYYLTNSEYMQLAAAMINAKEKLNALKSYKGKAEVKEEYIIFGAGNYGKQVMNMVGKTNVKFFIDNCREKQQNGYLGLDVVALDRAKDIIGDSQVVIAVSEKYVDEIAKQLEKYKINNYKTIREVKFEITRNKLLNRVNYINIYDKAIEWIKLHSIPDKGIITCTMVEEPYPEVSGYFIPTLIRWGYKELAVKYAKWLCSIQHESGAWYDSADEKPYIFDSAQIIKGLIAVRDLYPRVDEHIKKGCDWILSNMSNEGRLISPLENAWGDEKTFSELIHTYCISPLSDAGRILNIPEYVTKAEKIAKYYINNCRDKILDFSILSHFYAYVMEAMLDIGEENLAREAMSKIAEIQKNSGAVPAYKDVDWVCSTGLFQLALVWFRLGDIEHGNKAFEYACKLQNESGGWSGSYISEENADEINTYFPNAEISWAIKYFLDALYYKNIAEFEMQAPTFGENIKKSDGRYDSVKKAIESLNSNGEAKILDIGCGKGRYLKNLIEDYPNNKYYAVDLSKTVMEYFDFENVEKKQGSLTDIPFEDNSFDMVYTCEALEHVVDIKSGMKELCRVVKPGGKVVIIDKNKEMLGCLEIDKWERWFGEDELKTEMLLFCSEVEVIRDINYDNTKADGLFYCWVGTIQ